MAIKNYIEEAIHKIEVDRERVAVQIKDKVTREKILPFNAEIDKARDEAIAQKQSILNATIASQQEEFAKQRKEIIDAAEKKKSENANSIITAEVSIALAEYDEHLAALRNQCQKVKE